MLGLPFPNFYFTNSLSHLLCSEDTKKNQVPLLGNQDHSQIQVTDGFLVGWRGKDRLLTLLNKCFQIFTLARVQRKINGWRQIRERVRTEIQVALLKMVKLYRNSKYQEVAIVVRHDKKQSSKQYHEQKITHIRQQIIEKRAKLIAEHERTGCRDEPNQRHG